MLIDCTNIHIVQCGHHLLCQPFLITTIQNLINDHKREIREQESAKRDLEYHEARMKVYEKTN